MNVTSNLKRKIRQTYFPFITHHLCQCVGPSAVFILPSCASLSVFCITQSTYTLYTILVTMYRHVPLLLLGYLSAGMSMRIYVLESSPRTLSKFACFLSVHDCLLEPLHVGRIRRLRRSLSHILHHAPLQLICIFIFSDPERAILS